MSGAAQGPIQQIIDKALGLSRADDCVVIAEQSSSANLRWANNTITTNGVADTAELFVISVRDRRVGSVGRSFFPEERLEGLVRESEASCEGRPEAEDYMPLLSGSGTPKDWGEGSPRTGVGIFDRLAADLGALFRKAEASEVKLFGYSEHNVSTIFLATSSGIRRRFNRLQGQVEINGKSSDFKLSSWAGRVTKDFSDVDLGALYSRLEERLSWSRRQISLEPGRYETLLEPSPVTDMLFYAYWTSSARDADEGRTVFSKSGGGNRLGEKLYPDGVTIYSDPSEPGLEVEPFAVAVASSSYSSVFDNGLHVPPTQWVKDGVLSSLITTRHWAGRSGGRPTPFIDNLVFAADGGPSLDEMIASTERGLLVTCFWYIREVDPQTLLLTGLTRDGVFLIEKGKVAGAVNNFRYNMSPVDMLAQTTEIGKPEGAFAREFADYFKFARVPPLRVANFNMSSVSEAI